MGEISDMMLDGTLCEGCGMYIDNNCGQGFPRYCSRECEPDGFRCDPILRPRSAKHPNGSQKPIGCPACPKRFWSQGAMKRHWQAKHP